MRPCFAPDCCVDSFATDPDSLGDCVRRNAPGSPLSNVYNLALGQFRAPRFLAALLPALRYLVRHVIGAGSKKQVIGANTARVVASMQNTQFASGCASHKLPSNAVYRFDTARATAANFPVSAPVDVRRPLPAWAEFRSVFRDLAIPVDLRPKALGKALKAVLWQLPRYVRLVHGNLSSCGTDPAALLTPWGHLPRHHITLVGVS